jgi:hypothetical protein
MALINFNLIRQPGSSHFHRSEACGKAQTTVIADGCNHDALA